MDVELQVRAEVVMALGESWTRADGTDGPASLDRDGTAATLTLVRACGRAKESRMGLGPM